MTLPEANNRAANLAVIALVAITGFAFIPDIFREPEFTHMLDELLALALGIGALIWYFVGSNKWRRSIVPLLFSIGLVVATATGIILEMSDKEDVGDDIGSAVLVILTLGFAIYQYAASRRNKAVSTGVQ